MLSGILSSYYSSRATSIQPAYYPAVRTGPLGTVPEEQSEDDDLIDFNNASAVVQRLENAASSVVNNININDNVVCVAPLIPLNAPLRNNLLVSARGHVGAQPIRPIRNAHRNNHYSDDESEPEETSFLEYQRQKDALLHFSSPYRGAEYEACELGRRKHDDTLCLEAECSWYASGQ